MELLELKNRTKIVNFLEKFLDMKIRSSGHYKLLDIFNDSELCDRYYMTIKDNWKVTAISSAFIVSFKNVEEVFPCIECSCARMIKLAKENDIWNDSKYNPKIGDIVFYEWDTPNVENELATPSHVAIIADICGDDLKIIEADYKDSVKYHHINTKTNYIFGYIAPRYVSYIKRYIDNKFSISDGDANKELMYDKKYEGERITARAVCLREYYTNRPNTFKNDIIVQLPRNLKVQCTGYYVKYKKRYVLCLARCKCSDGRSFIGLIPDKDLYLV